MDLFDRYLHAVKGCLPKSQRDDIVRELSDELRSQAEERESELGRDLTEAEQAEILTPFGHPLLLAARYRPHQHLIGSALMPVYWFVLKIALAGMLIVHFVAAVVLLATGRGAQEIVSTLVTLPVGPAIMVFGWVTLVFAIADRHVPRLPYFANWTPASLPQVRPGPSGPSRFTLLCEIVGTTFFIVWWSAIPSQQWLIFGPGAAIVELAPLWDRLYLPVLLFATAGLIAQWFVFLRPDWRTLRSSTKLVTNLVALVTLSVLANAGELVVVADGVAAAADAAKIAKVVNMSFRIGLAVTAVIVSIDVVQQTIRLLRNRHRAFHSIGSTRA